MSFRSKNKVKARERVMKSRGEVKNLSRFKRQRGYPFKAEQHGKTLDHDRREEPGAVSQSDSPGAE